MPWRALDKNNSPHIYLHNKTDRFNRPVIVVEVRKHMKDDRDLYTAQMHALSIVEEAAEIMRANGVENVVAVWDMRGFSGLNADLDLAKFCISSLFRECVWGVAGTAGGGENGQIPNPKHQTLKPPSTRVCVQVLSQASGVRGVY